MVYHMSPGTGVHIPINTPHWLRNKNNVSVTLNVNFQFHDQYWANLYKANYYLRRAGITPNSPGAHPVADRLKSLAFTAVKRVQQSMKAARTSLRKLASKQKNRQLAGCVDALLRSYSDGNFVPRTRTYQPQAQEQAAVPSCRE